MSHLLSILGDLFKVKLFHHVKESRKGGPNADVPVHENFCETENHHGKDRIVKWSVPDVRPPTQQQLDSYTPEALHETKRVINGDHWVAEHPLVFGYIQSLDQRIAELEAKFAVLDVQMQVQLKRKEPAAERRERKDEKKEQFLEIKLPVRPVEPPPPYAAASPVHHSLGDEKNENGADKGDAKEEKEEKEESEEDRLAPVPLSRQMGGFHFPPATNPKFSSKTVGFK